MIRSLKAIVLKKKKILTSKSAVGVQRCIYMSNLMLDWDSLPLLRFTVVENSQWRQMNLYQRLQNLSLFLSSPNQADVGQDPHHFTTTQYCKGKRKQALSI